MGAERRDELIERLKQGVVRFTEGDVITAANDVLDNGVDAYDAIMNGLAAGMEVVSDLYTRNEYFVPEVLLASDAMYEGLTILKPHITEGSAGSFDKGDVVIGTVAGDVHDIGKNIVKTMFEIAGFNVHDLGRDVSAERFVEELDRTGAGIVAVSAMMTTTMLGMPACIEKIKSKHPEVIVMVGGAPLSSAIAEKWGADGYADNAQGALTEANRLWQLRTEGRLVRA